ncbi:hypothetical protein [Biformimicrobium ophioploci]|uniref:Transcriptional regulator SutA n=1 Tax=Biformimicrobium ophioploci TaxID=3036711 RepID=A0ABQ6LV71_9GAMM|nr:hypothetical protein [Microbulbifer sp. NKW57]GMG85951.1 transcriptional regulator SutA [Microbulbifer sp. NKW57]
MAEEIYSNGSGKAAAGRGKGRAPKQDSKLEDLGEERSISSRLRARERLTDDVESFLASGGTISEIDPNVTADPPRKPQPKYGSRPI